MPVDENTGAEELQPTQDDGAEVSVEELQERGRQAAEEAVQAEANPPEPTQTQQQEDPNDAYNRVMVQYGKLEKKMRQQEQRLAALSERDQQYTSLVERLKDPKQRYKAIEEHGGDYREWTDQVLSGDKPPDPKDVALEELRAEVSALKQERQQEREQLQQQTAQDRMEQARRQVKTFVEQNEGYELIKTLGQYDLVIQEYQKRAADGDPVGDEIEVFKAVEGQLKDTVRKQLEGLRESPAFNALLQELGYSSKPAQQGRDQGKKLQTASGRTLGNDLSAERGPVQEEDWSKLTPDDLRKRGIEAANRAVQKAQERAGLEY